MLALLDRLRRVRLQRQPIWRDLPGTCFISHSYADRTAVERLRRLMPGHCRPVVFPPIDVPPDRRVSDELVRAVLGCEGLVWIDSSASSSSFWVAFERDYAARAGKPVFSFAPGTSALSADATEPKRKKTAFFCLPSDEERVFSILRWMRTERHFEMWYNEKEFSTYAFMAKGWYRDITDNGFDSFLMFVSQSIYDTTLWNGKHLDFIGRIIASKPQACLIVELDRIEDPPGLGHKGYVASRLGLVDGERPVADFPPSFRLPGHAATYDAFLSRNIIDVTGPGGAINWNRIDDLIVRLYWTAYSGALPPHWTAARI